MEMETQEINKQMEMETQELNKLPPISSTQYYERINNQN